MTVCPECGHPYEDTITAEDCASFDRIERATAPQEGTSMSQEIRNYIYGIVVAAIPLLVAAGFIGPDEAQLWLTLAAALLGLGSAALAKPNANPKKVTVTRKADPEARHIPGT